MLAQPCIALSDSTRLEAPEPSTPPDTYPKALPTTPPDEAALGDPIPACHGELIEGESSDCNWGIDELDESDWQEMDELFTATYGGPDDYVDPEEPLEEATRRLHRDRAILCRPGRSLTRQQWLQVQAARGYMPKAQAVVSRVLVSGRPRRTRVARATRRHRSATRRAVRGGLSDDDAGPGWISRRATKLPFEPAEALVSEARHG